MNNGKMTGIKHKINDVDHSNLQHYKNIVPPVKIKLLIITEAAPMPEWGISFSDKAKDAMEPYRFANMIANYA